MFIKAFFILFGWSFILDDTHLRNVEKTNVILFKSIEFSSFAMQNKIDIFYILY